MTSLQSTLPYDLIVDSTPLPALFDMSQFEVSQIGDTDSKTHLSALAMLPPSTPPTDSVPPKLEDLQGSFSLKRPDDSDRGKKAKRQRVPTKKDIIAHTSIRWSEEEKNKLMDLMRNYKKIPQEVSEILPGRTYESCYAMYKRLKYLKALKNAIDPEGKMNDRQIHEISSIPLTHDEYVFLHNKLDEHWTLQRISVHLKKNKYALETGFKKFTGRQLITGHRCIYGRESKAQSASPLPPPPPSPSPGIQTPLPIHSLIHAVYSNRKSAHQELPQPDTKQVRRQ